MQRRDFLKNTVTTAVAAAALARPAIVKAASSRVLKFIPQSDLPQTDPVVTTVYAVRNHGLMVWDQLFGLDNSFTPQPQMANGYKIEDDGRRVTITLRDGLRFHDNTPVLARDAVASIKRWAARDPLGQAMIARTDELSAPDDRTILFRLKQPFPLLIYGLAKSTTPIMVVMPERLASTDPTKNVPELIGSGPFKWVASERDPGALMVYERFADYKPRPNGKAEWTSGPKQVFFDRVEWHVIPDAGTAASSMQAGEMDWWETPTSDLAVMLASNHNIRVEICDPTGNMCLMRFNQLHPPFNNPAIRRAVLGAVNQADFMTAVIGDNATLWHDKAGFYPPDTSLYTTTGMDVLTCPRDYDKVKHDLAAAGYKGEKVVVLGPTDWQAQAALAQVAADTLSKGGMNVDLQAMDWPSAAQRRFVKGPVEEHGWSVFCTWMTGLDSINPAVNVALRGNGASAWPGWPELPKLEALHGEWMDAPDVAAQKALAVQIQLQAFQDVPYIPTGQYFSQWAYRTSIKDVLKGLPFFWNVRPA